MSNVSILFTRPGARVMLVFVPKQHLVKAILFANMLIGPAYPGQFASKMSIISIFIHLHHINRNNIVEDEEHVLLHCPEYDICRQEYPELFWGTNI